jgi:hypothetical protein
MPVFNTPQHWAAVADDVRDTATQRAHFERLAVGMHARDEEMPVVVDVLQLCERTHGYSAIVRALIVVASAVESAVALTGLSLSALAGQQGLANPGLLVGVMVEDCAGLPADQRRFPVSAVDPRVGSPHVEFVDCMVGACAAETLGQLRETNLVVVRPYSALATAGGVWQIHLTFQLGPEGLCGSVSGGAGRRSGADWGAAR